MSRNQGRGDGVTASPFFPGLHANEEKGAGFIQVHPMSHVTFTARQPATITATPVRLGALRLANRRVMLPAIRCQTSLGQVATLAMMEHYAANADAGLLLTEATYTLEGGRRHPNAPGIHSAEQVVAWRGVTDAVHQAGGRIALHVVHSGHADMASTHITAAAQRARRAGFDAMEIDATVTSCFGLQLASGECGGLVDAVDAAMAVMGASRVGVRLGLNGACPMGRPGEAMRITADAIVAMERLRPAFLHLLAPLAGDDMAALARSLFQGRVILNAGLGHDNVGRLLDTGMIDAATFMAKPPVANDLFSRAGHQAPLLAAE